MKGKSLEIAYEMYYQPLFLYAFSLTKNREDAEDLVANTFVKALISFEKGNLKAWLYTVLKNEFYNLYKKRKRMIDSHKIEVAWIEDSLDILEDYILEERKCWLYKKIYDLERIEREVMLLSIQSDLHDDVIASLLHMTVENVRVTRYRVKQKLMKTCEKEGLL